MTDLEVEAAMCLWEAFIDARTMEALPSGIADLWDEEGTSAMRLRVRDLAPPLEALWLSFDEQEQFDMGSFDWDFCPRVVSLMDGSMTLPTREQIEAYYIANPL